MLFDFANVLAFMAVGGLFLWAVLWIGSFLRPKVPGADKELIYECGERPVGGAWIQFNMRFYLIALVFIIFDVEIAFMFPVAAVFLGWVHRGQGMIAFIEILVFMLILLTGLIYLWAKRDLEWVKAVRE